jgi:hypothetical protein
MRAIAFLTGTGMANIFSKALFSFSAISFSVFSFNAYAQSTVMFDNFLPSVIDTNLRNQVLWEPYQSNNDQDNQKQLTQRSKNLSFKPVLSQRKANLANFVSKIRAVDQSGAAELEQLFSSTDIIEAIAQALSPYGLRVDNVADAYTVYWMSSWQASVGKTDDFQPNEISKVRAQAQLALLNVPEISNATESDKQAFAEALLVQTALIDGAMEQAAGNTEQLRAIAFAVRKGASAAGLDLDAMTLTGDGFVPVKKGN